VTLHVPKDLAVGVYQSLAISWRCTIEGVTAAAVNSALIGAIQTDEATPGGSVREQATGAPIADATVTLYQIPDWRLRTAPTDTNPASCESLASRPVGQSWSQPAPVDLGKWVLAEAVEGNPVTITPASNPQTTGSNGGFGWQVAEGCYYVEVTAPGYAPAVSPVIGVQNALTDLTILVTARQTLFLPWIVR